MWPELYEPGFWFTFIIIVIIAAITKSAVDALVENLIRHLERKRAYGKETDD